MNFLSYVIVILCGIIGAVPTLYCVFSLIGVLGWKIYRRIRYKISLYK